MLISDGDSGWFMSQFHTICGFIDLLSAVTSAFCVLFFYICRINPQLCSKFEDVVGDFDWKMHDNILAEDYDLPLRSLYSSTYCVCCESPILTMEELTNGFLRRLAFLLQEETCDRFCDYNLPSVTHGLWGNVSVSVESDSRDFSRGWYHYLRVLWDIHAPRRFEDCQRNGTDVGMRRAIRSDGLCRDAEPLLNIFCKSSLTHPSTNM